MAAVDSPTRSPTPTISRSWPSREGNEEHDNRIDSMEMDTDTADPRLQNSKRKRTSVLIGQAILQQPIWGFAMSYGVFQEYFSSNWTFGGSREVTGVIGTTTNGVMYLSMPFLFALFSRRWAHRRRVAALAGAVLASCSFLLSAFSSQVWHLVATQGVLASLGCALMYSPTTLSLGEWFNNDIPGGGGNRAVAYGIVLSCKNVVGSACPFLVRVLLDRYGFKTTMIIWAALVAGTSIPSIFMVPTHPSSLDPHHRRQQQQQGDGEEEWSDSRHRSRRRGIPWNFLKHRTFYIYSIATMLQSSGYGLPQTYLNTYAHEEAQLSRTSATLLLTLFNVPGIASSAFFGYLSDNRFVSLSAATVTCVPAVGAALAAFLFWGLTSPGGMALLVLFSVTFGFFAGGYSATWGGVINELELEAARENEAIDSGMMYGLLNGARGIGYVTGGLAGVPLLESAKEHALGQWAYGTSYGPLIIFTGLSSAFGGWAVLWRWKKLMSCF